MREQATALKVFPPSLITGRIRVVEGGLYWVETATGIIKSRRASSCLLEPQSSDLVLLYGEDTGEAYVLAVLERQEGIQNTLLFEEGVSIKTKKGDFSVAAEGVRFASEQFALSSADMQIDSLKAKFRIIDLSFLGKTLNSRIQKINWAAEFCDSMVDRLSQKVKRSYRLIEDFEQTRAGRVLCIVRDTLFMKGKQSVIMAEKRIKMDAEKIHLG